VETLKDRLRAGLTAAMRAQDDVARSALRLALSAVTRAEVAGKEHATLTDDQVIDVVRSEIKKRVEAAGIYDEAGRRELADRERAEAAVLAPYLPAELSGQELAAIVAEELARLAAGGATGPRAMGQAIKAVRERVGNQASGGRIAEAVKAALQP
jgi:uncharacterized protein YqeY